MTKPVLRCEMLSKTFNGVPAVRNASLVLSKGEILSILGPSGCGKTTLLRMIGGFEIPDSGEIEVNGQLVSNDKIQIPAEKRRIGMVFQDYALFPHLSVEENIKFGIKDLKNIDRETRFKQVLDLVQMTGLGKRYPHELSGGQQQRVALARTIAPQPVAVLLDEPFSNLDAEMRRQMRTEIQSILRDSDIATLFVTHDRDEAFAMADTMAVMNLGGIDQVGRPDEIYDVPKTRFVAQLAGGCDMLRGRLSGHNAITEIGTFLCTTLGKNMPQGSIIDLMVHPADFQVVLDERGDHIIVSREFRGHETIFVVRLTSGKNIECAQYSDRTIQVGDRVSLTHRSSIPFVAFESDGMNS